MPPPEDPHDDGADTRRGLSHWSVFRLTYSQTADGDLEFGGQKCGDRTADAAGNQRNQHGEPNGVAGVDQGGGDGSTERKRAFNGQVRDIQDAEGKEDAEGHDGPQQTWRNGG